MKMYLWEFLFWFFFFSRIASWLDCKELYTMWFCSLIGIEPPRPRKEVPKAAQKIRKKEMSFSLIPLCIQICI